MSCTTPAKKCFMVTVRKICLRYLEEGLEGALNEKPRPGQLYQVQDT